MRCLEVTLFVASCGLGRHAEPFHPRIALPQPLPAREGSSLPDFPIGGILPARSTSHLGIYKFCSVTDVVRSLTFLNKPLSVTLRAPAAVGRRSLLPLGT
jgi:hypothetical protein